MELGQAIKTRVLVRMAPDCSSCKMQQQLSLGRCMMKENYKSGTGPQGYSLSVLNRRLDFEHLFSVI
jgi:hypothetical protein